MKMKFDPTTVKFCEAYRHGKLNQLPFQTHKIIVKAPFENSLFWCMGPSPYTSLEGYRYYLIFVYAFKRLPGCTH